MLHLLVVRAECQLLDEQPGLRATRISSTSFKGMFTTGGWRSAAITSVGSKASSLRLLFSLASGQEANRKAKLVPSEWQLTEGAEGYHRRCCCLLTGED